MTADECRAYSEVWLQRSTSANISNRRATILLAMHRTCDTLAKQIEYDAILKEEYGTDRLSAA